MSVRRLGRYACTVVHAAGPRHTSTYRLELLSVGCWVHPLLGSGEPWPVCLVLSRLVFEMIQWLWPLGAEHHVRVGPAIGVGPLDLHAGSDSPSIEK